MVSIYAEAARIQGMIGALLFCVLLYSMLRRRSGCGRGAALLGAAFFLTFFGWGYCRTEQLSETGIYIMEQYGEGQSVVIKGKVYAVSEKQYSTACYVKKARIYKTDAAGNPVGRAYSCERLYLVLPVIGDASVTDQETVSDKAVLNGQAVSVKAAGSGEEAVTNASQVSDNVLLSAEPVEIVKPVMQLRAAEVFCGDEITAFAICTSWRQQRNEGEFDEKQYYTSLGIQGKFKVTQYQCARGKGIKAKTIYLLAKCRKECAGRIRRLAEPSKAAIYQGILLGEKGEIDSEVVGLYQMSGISHILSISGLHISLLGSVIYRLVRRKRGLFCSTAAAVTVMGLYTLMVGNGYSTRRAFVMFMLSLLAELLGRSYDLLSALYLALLLLLLENPFCIYHAGLQLSFGAVAGIGLLYPIVEKYCHLQNRIVQTFTASLCINLFTMPIMIHTYHLLPMYSVFINLIVVALMGIMVAMGMLGLLLSYVWWDGGRICFIFGGKILWFYEWLSKAVLKLPDAVKVVGETGFFRTMLYYLMLFLMIRVMTKRCRRERNVSVDTTIGKKEAGTKEIGRKEIGRNEILWKAIVWKAAGRNDMIRHDNLRTEISKKLVCRKVLDKKNGLKEKDRKKATMARLLFFRRTVTFFFCSVLFVLATKQKNSGLTVKMLDVGQGDSIFIACGDTTLLVDAGSSSKRELEKYTLFPFLKANGVQRLDYLIITHSDSDHISGAAELMRERIQQKSYVKTLVLQDIGEVVKDEAYHGLEEEAQKNGVAVLYLSKGMTLANEKMALTCLWPLKGEASGDKNTLSIVFLLTEKEKGIVSFSMLFTGDLTGEGEERMMRENRLLTKVDVLKTGHHGSAGSSGEAFLAALQPRLALISCGENNRYGHPHEEVLERFFSMGCDVYRTDRSGCITVSVEGEEIKVIPFCK